MSKLSSCIEDQLSWALSDYDGINIGALSEDLADTLKRKGYCEDKYATFEQALLCPINKKRENDCRVVHCPNHMFCMLLRKEGYV